MKTIFKAGVKHTVRPVYNNTWLQVLPHLKVLIFSTVYTWPDAWDIYNFLKRYI